MEITIAFLSLLIQIQNRREECEGETNDNEHRREPSDDEDGKYETSVRDGALKGLNVDEFWEYCS